MEREKEGKEDREEERGDRFSPSLGMSTVRGVEFG